MSRVVSRYTGEAQRVLFPPKSRATRVLGPFSPKLETAHSHIATVTKAAALLLCLIVLFPFSGSTRII